MTARSWGIFLRPRETYAYIHSAYPHMNEYQLAIAESTINQRPELAVTRETGKQIMTIEQAEIFALQRCKKARDAVRLIGALMETYGFLPSSGDGAETWSSATRRRPGSWRSSASAPAGPRKAASPAPSGPRSASATTRP